MKATDSAPLRDGHAAAARAACAQRVRAVDTCYGRALLRVREDIYSYEYTVRR